MPANRNYLTRSPFQRLLKIFSGFVGGYIITELFFMNLIQRLDTPSMMLTLRFGGFILWAVLLLCAFLFKSGWKVLGIFSLISFVLAAILYLNI